MGVQMPWTCNLLDIVGTKEIRWDPPPGGGVCGETVLVDRGGQTHKLKELPIGTMFYVPKDCDFDSWPWYLADKDDLSDHYFQRNAHRQPLLLVLPGHQLFLIDGKCWDNGRKYGGWTVTGEAPLITVQPSINCKGLYHGFLTNGVLSDDVDGRSFV